MSDYHRACALSEVPEEGAIGVEVAGVPVAIIRAEGEVFALRDVCSHEEVPLSEGEVYDHTVECWLHGSCFDLRTRQADRTAGHQAGAYLPVRVDGDDVLVDFRFKHVLR